MRLNLAIELVEGHWQAAGGLYNRYINKLKSLKPKSEPLFDEPINASNFLYKLNMMSKRFSPEYVAKKEIEYKNTMKANKKEVKEKLMNDLLKSKLKR
jgi:hypothetical protein